MVDPDTSYPLQSFAHSMPVFAARNLKHMWASYFLISTVNYVATSFWLPQHNRYLYIIQMGKQSITFELGKGVIATSIGTEQPAASYTYMRLYRRHQLACRSALKRILIIIYMYIYKRRREYLNWIHKYLSTLCRYSALGIQIW